MTPLPTTTPIGWTRALDLADLPPGALTTRKLGGHQLVVGRRADGAVFALDNRCPHEGYPLAQGALQGCQLTCTWHNWKFDVTDGSCLLGEEGVRRYPVRVVGERVEVDLTPPDPALEIARRRASLTAALERAQLGRALREGARLLELGVIPRRLALDVARFDGERAEYGATHVLAVAADAARLAERTAGPDALYALAPLLDLAIDEDARLPARPLPPAAEGDLADFLAAVEAEDASRAEGLLRGALARGVPREELEAWLLHAASLHFTDFGHQLIYLVKAQELFAGGEATAEDAAAVLGGLTYSLVLGTREDTLPYMRRYGERLAEVEPRLAEVHAAARDGAPCDPAPLVDAALDGSAAEACAAVWSALEAGVPAARVAGALVAAAAQRLHRFDLALDQDVDVAEGWLWATHRLTFASAVHEAAQRWSHPDAIRLLFQSVAFVHSGRRMDAPPERRLAPRARPASPGALQEALRARQPQAALDLAQGLLEAGRADDVARALTAHALDDVYTVPIVQAHALKTAVAAADEHAALAAWPALRGWPLLAATRFLASPVVERRVRGAARRALRWVVEGIQPRKLTQ